MAVQIKDIRIRNTRPLITPAVLADELPLPEAGAACIQQARNTIAAILQGDDPRLLAIVGPCSIHDVDAAMDYAQRLQEFSATVADAVFMVMRVYFEKPRTVVGWKGLINDPDLDGSFHINKGLHLARKLLLDITADGLPVASEFLDTTIGQYYAELISFGAIGARTVESQVHRELVSGLSMPVGIKNRTDGNIEVAIDALLAARHSHWFPSLTPEGTPAILETTGNDQTCMILRGGKDSGPNYDASSISRAETRLAQSGLPPVVIIDCSHGNSGSDPDKQADVIQSIMSQIDNGNKSIRGIMFESNLRPGKQPPAVPGKLVYGQSITDACLSIEASNELLQQLADCIRRAE
jgi:3-deoxy-7-phosphoheptulonate synthase